MIDPRLLDPEKVFEDGFLLTKMIDELTAEVQNPYKGRRMRSNLQDDIQEGIKDSLQEITKREKEMVMMLKFIELLADKSRQKIRDIKQQIEDQKRENSDCRQEQEDVTERLRALNETKERLVIKNEKLETFMEELEKNHERVRNDLTSANFELERLKKAKEESEAAQVSESLSVYTGKGSVGFELVITEERSLGSLSHSNKELAEKNKKLHEELASMLLGQKKENYYKELYHSSKLELDELKEKKLPLVSAYEKQLKELKEKYTMLVIDIETNDIGRFKALGLESEKDLPVSRSRLNSSAKSGANQNARIYEKMQNPQLASFGSESIILDSDSKNRNNSLWNEILKLQISELRNTEEAAGSTEHAEENDSISEQSADGNNLGAELLESENHNQESESKGNSPQGHSKIKIPTLQFNSCNTFSDLGEPGTDDTCAKATQTESESIDQIIEENEEKEEDRKAVETKASLKRKEALEEYFIMTTQCAKLNSPHFNDVSIINTKTWYQDVMNEGIPFHEWYDWINDRLMKEVSKDSVPAREFKGKKTRNKTEGLFPLFTKWMKVTHI